MLDLMQMQNEAGHEAIPFSMHYPKNLENNWDEFFVSGIDTEYGSSGLFHALKQALRALWSREAKRKFESLIDVFEPDIIHVHNIYTHISPSILKVCERRGIPVVMTVHDYSLVSANYALWDFQNAKPMNLNKLGLLNTARTRFIKNSYLATIVLEIIQKWQRLLGQYKNRVNLFFANSEFTASILLNSDFAKDKIKVLYPFTQIPKLVSYKDDRYVLYMGALEDYKGVHILIEAMKNFPQVALKIVGVGPFENKLRELSGGMDNVEFVGFASGKVRDELLANARVCVVPSIWYESFGLSAVEAMARMTPVIVSDIGGLSEIVEPGLNGELFKAGDYLDLSRKLKVLINDPAYARKLGENAYKRASQLCDPKDHLNKIMAIYSDLTCKND